MIFYLSLTFTILHLCTDFFSHNLLWICASDSKDSCVPSILDNSQLLTLRMLILSHPLNHPLCELQPGNTLGLLTLSLVSANLCFSFYLFNCVKFEVIFSDSSSSPFLLSSSVSSLVFNSSIKVLFLLLYFSIERSVYDYFISSIYDCFLFCL